MSRVLLVEDNEDLALGLRNNLEIEGYEVRTTTTGEQALREIAAPTDLVILDLMLPDISGLRVLQQARRSGFRGAVLILTARGEEEDKVRGLRLGADDYLTKPFGLLELLARVEALLRRGALKPHPDERVTLGSLVIQPALREVQRDSERVELTPKEYDLLLALVQARGAVVSRRELLRRVWGYQDHVYTRTVDTHIGELRRKLEPDPTSPSLILTVRKVGYRAAV